MFTALLPTRQDIHPLGCHRPRIPDRVIFDKFIQVLVFGCGYRRIDDTTRTTLAERDLQGQIAHKGIPAPIQATTRWPVQRTHAWGNQFGKLRWCTERTTSVVEFWICLAQAIVTLGRLLRRAWTRHRWEGRPRRRP
jgi:hypothetical protein